MILYMSRRWCLVNCYYIVHWICRSV